MKAKNYKLVKKFTDIPNVGPAMVRDFTVLGVQKSGDLTNKDPHQLYQKICQMTGTRKDPCVLDTYLAIVDFMNGAPARPWYWYSKARKSKYPGI
jgi:hypothetical protein